MNVMQKGLSLMCLAVLGACGGGGGSSPPPIPPLPSPEALSAVGVITALDSATVNGVRYETDATTVMVNGSDAIVADLKVGQIVALEGEINFGGDTGTANFIGYNATVIGPVENIDAELSQLVVMGQTVRTDANTVFDPSIDPDTFAGLTVDSTAQISGFLNAAGEVIATLVEPDTTTTDVQLIGSVAGLDLANMLFTLNRLTVDYGDATLIDLPGGEPANGMFVAVRGALVSGILEVDEIESLYDSDGGTPGERAQAQGPITRFGSPTDFDVNGFPVTTDGNTDFASGTISDLQANAEVIIDGEIATGGGSILADEITFGRVVNPTETRPFALSDFTEISVSTLFSVTVNQGSDFSVEVTADVDIIDGVAVTLAGSTLNIGVTLPAGDNNIDTLEAVVTMPVLDSVTLGGVVNVVLNDFEQQQLTVNVGGVSRLRGNSLMIGDLTATVSGVSLLDFADIRPLGSANIIIEGVSQATLNMDVGTTLTGSVGTGQGTGISTLFYYGTDVIDTVATDGLSSVVRLGDTRP